MTYIYKKIRKNLILYTFSIPLLIFLFYFYVVGRKRFESKSIFIVRSSIQKDINGGLAGLITGGNSISVDDSRFLKEYLKSPQLITNISNEFKIEKLFKKKGLDIFAGIRKDTSQEVRNKFIKKQISIILNEQSGIIELKTVALDRDTAYKLNKFLIKESEQFINNFNQEMYLKQLDFVNNQVIVNLKKLKTATNKLKIYKTNKKIIDSNIEIKSSAGYISALEKELVDLKVKLATLKRRFVQKEEPEIIYLENQIDELRNQIFIERENSVSSKGKNLNEALTKIKEINIAIKFSNDLYNTSLQTAEKVKIESIQKQKFMALLSEPIKAEDQSFYWRHKGFLTSISVIAVTIALIKFFLGMAESHRN